MFEDTRAYFTDRLRSIELSTLLNVTQKAQLMRGVFLYIASCALFGRLYSLIQIHQFIIIIFRLPDSGSWLKMREKGPRFRRTRPTKQYWRKQRKEEVASLWDLLEQNGRVDYLHCQNLNVVDEMTIIRSNSFRCCLNLESGYSIIQIHCFRASGRKRTQWA